jgi:hypothetical protein
MLHMCMPAVLGVIDWRAIGGWASLVVGALVLIGAWTLLRIIRSTGRREMQRTGDVTLVPLMTLPGFASALLLVTGSAGLLGWLGGASSAVLDAVFGLWWLSNALVMGHVTRARRQRDRHWSLGSIGALLAALIAAAAGVWFVRATVVWTVRQFS